VLYLDEEKEKTTAFYSATETADVIALLPHLFNSAIRVIQTLNSGKGTIPRADHLQLCDTCPYAEECDSRFGEIVVSEEISEADNVLHRLVDYLGKHKLVVTPDGYINGPRFIRLKIIPLPEKGVTVAKIQKLANDMKVGLDLTAPPLIQAQSGHVSVDVPRKNTKPLMLSPLIREGEVTRPQSDVAVPLGAEIDGRVFWLNFADPTMSSVLVGGTSGSGKSVLLQSLVLGLRLANPNVRTEFTLIDPKRVTFMKMSLDKIDGDLLIDPKQALDRLTLLVEEMEQRYDLLESEKCFDIATYNIANPHARLTHHVTVIDEFADLMYDKKANKDLELAIQRLGQKGRAAGFHLILATQRPEAKVISPLIKANLQVKIAMKVASQKDSRIILDEPGAECLIGNGDMLLGGSVKITRLQGAWASRTDYETLG
jgi:S-DNA-T family DNA segregation ATPase FtsK/SpoIIIE